MAAGSKSGNIHEQCTSNAGAMQEQGVKAKTRQDSRASVALHQLQSIAAEYDRTFQFGGRRAVQKFCALFP
ncbi:MAG: hypothetical protein ABI476_00805 [Oxalobacteraceae bacterium]